VDGVPALLAPSSGPTHAGLTFRVGQADETLARRGITHLVEHLTLHHLGMADYHYNGATGDVITTFHLQGSDDDVTAFLSAVCDSLVSPPLDRLEMEREILRTEESSRSRSVLASMGLWRYGAQGYGLHPYPEYGLSMLGPDDVRAWIARYFNRENAVFWIAGNGVPRGLHFNLPSGAAQPLPPATSTLPTTPAYFCGPSRAVGFEGLVRRGVAGSVFAGVLERELFRSLRQESGLSYAATAVYEPRGDGYASVTALADSLPEKRDAVVGGFIDVLAKLRVGRLEKSDLDAVLAKAHDALSSPEADAARLPSHALNHLVGHPLTASAEYLAKIEAVTLDDLRAVATEVYGSGLLMVPEGTSADWAGFAAAPTSSARAVTGTTHGSRAGGGRQLVIGDEGVSVTAPHGRATVTFGQCAAMLAWPDGGRLLIGTDGIACRIEPTLYQVDADAIRSLDARIDPQRYVKMPPRPLDDIPQPPPPPPPAATIAKPPEPGKLELVTAVVVGLVAVICCGWSAIVTAAEASNPDASGGEWAVVGVSWFLLAVLALPTAVLLRRRFRKRS
jgi:predicted Zn-dependent peptidase